MKRVVITGMGTISPIGNTMEQIFDSLMNNRSGVSVMDEWHDINALRVCLAGRCKGFDAKRIHRRDRRTMGRMAVMAGLSTLDAVQMAGLEKKMVSSPTTGISMGSTTGSGEIIEKTFTDFFSTGGISCLEGTTFMKIMNHSISANVAAMLSIKGRVLSPCSACATSTQAIGEGYETIKNGCQSIMICGGADELHFSTAGVFDVLHAASKQGVQEKVSSPRPFDAQRDGLVVGEGAAVLVLEEYGHAAKRGAQILGEIIGYHTCCDGLHMTSPSAEGMHRCMQGALESAGCRGPELDYINAHATGTRLGDMAESRAIQMVCGDSVPVSGTKGFTGHTLAASGAMEIIFCLLMMKNSVIIPTLHLEHVDPKCEGILHVKEKMEKKLEKVMSSNFAFGGINATLILQK